MDLSANTLSNLKLYSHKFSTAQPFKYVVIDNFFDESTVLGLSKDFPPFNPNNALNEYGKPGPKCTYEDLESISSFYANFDVYVRSPAFLRYISILSGIDGLKIDKNMYGGGTHENISGAELDLLLI